MPIALSTFAKQTDWEGCTWSVPSKQQLAKAVAMVAVGQAMHLAKILHYGGLGPKPSSKDSVSAAIGLLTPGKEVYHRDGWMFQVMSWLAANLSTPNALMNPPQMIHAHKGLDGLQIVLDASQAVTAVIIFEDKATEHPRSTVTKKVWPEFESFENGERQNLLAADATTILACSKHPDPSEAVAQIMWSQVKKYRLSITDVVSTDVSQASLLAGYADFVPGVAHRRRAEIFEVADVRTWMADLALLTVGEAQAIAASN